MFSFDRNWWGGTKALGFGYRQVGKYGGTRIYFVGPLVISLDKDD